MRLLFCLTILLAASRSAGADEIQLRVDCRTSAAPVHNFWHTFGFSPIYDLFRNPYHVYMAYAGSVPHQGLTHVRMHRIVNIIGVEWQDAEPRFDWERLDAATDLLRRYGLHHHFEFDLKGKGRGAPKIKEASREAAARHRAMARGIATHAVERYGHDTVASWWWETPNEGQFPWNDAGVVFWDATVQGLADVDPAFARRFGGPAALYRNDPLDFIKKLEASENNLTGERQHQVGFVSHHIKKGATEQVDSEIGHIERLREAFPRYAEIPFVNTEHDPWNGWGKDHDWAYGPRAASWMANAIAQQQQRIIEDLGQPYFCSTDNGFLGRSHEWTKRTQMVLIGHDDKGFALIKKPAHTVFTMLALLGDRRLPVAGAPPLREGIGVLATAHGENREQIALLCYNDTRADTALAIRLDGLGGQERMLSHLRLDATHGNPYRIWHEAEGLPSPETLQAMRAEMELPYLTEPQVYDGGPLRFDLPADSVSLVLLSTRPERPPGEVDGLQVVEMPGLHGPEHLLFWTGLACRTLRGYEVLASVDGGPYQRINQADLLCTAFMWPKPAGQVRYRVRAIDFWGRTGE